MLYLRRFHLPGGLFLLTPNGFFAALRNRDWLRVELWAVSHRRNPPRKALRLSPARQPGGSFFNLWTLPPPSTTLPVRGRLSDVARRLRQRAAIFSCHASPMPEC